VLLDFNQEFLDSIEIQFFDLNTGNVANSQFVDVEINGFVGMDHNAEISSGLSVFPNPTTRNLAIRLLEQNGNQINITMTDILGNIVRKKEINNNQESIVIDMMGLRTGTYFVNIQSGSKYTTKKVVLIK
jgi:hypothetical protein